MLIFEAFVCTKCNEIFCANQTCEHLSSYPTFWRQALPLSSELLSDYINPDDGGWDNPWNNEYELHVHMVNHLIRHHYNYFCHFTTSVTNAALWMPHNLRTRVPLEFVCCWMWWRIGWTGTWFPFSYVLWTCNSTNDARLF